MNGVIFQCASCRALAAIHDVQLHEDRAGLACAVCGSVTWLPIHAGDKKPASSAHVVVEPQKSLPPVTALSPVARSPASTIAPAIEGGEHTPAQRERIQELLQKLSPTNEQQEQLARAFEKLLATWGDQGAHRELCRRANSVGELPFIGQRYRAVLQAVPEDAQARRAQGDILTLATAALGAVKDLGSIPSDDERKRRSLAGLAIGAIIVLVIFFVMQLTGGLLRPPEGQEMIEQPPAVDVR